MRRLPLLASFVLFLVLCASIAYWAMEMFEPPLRPVAAPPRVMNTEVNINAASGVLGGRAAKTVVASNYQLRGIIMAGRDSVAILSADGKPAQAVRVDREIAPGVVVKEVQRDHVLLSDNGATKRVELPENAKAQVNVASSSPVPVQPAPGLSPGRPPSMSGSGPVIAPGSPPPNPPEAAAPAAPATAAPQNSQPDPSAAAPAILPVNPNAASPAAASAGTAPASGTPGTTAPPSMVINPGAAPAQGAMTGQSGTAGTPNSSAASGSGNPSPAMPARQSRGSVMEPPR